MKRSFLGFGTINVFLFLSTYLKLSVLLQKPPLHLLCTQFKLAANGDLPQRCRVASALKRETFQLSQARSPGRAPRRSLWVN